MAKFFGKVGFATSTETAAGVFTDVMTANNYSGEIIKNVRSLDEGEYLNKDISVQNSISIVADAYASENFFAIRYVEWAGVLWTVTSVEVQRPRLLLRLGGVYNGPIAQ